MTTTEKLVEAKSMLAKYMTAEAAILAGKSYKIVQGNSIRTMTREDLQEIIKGRKEWENRVARLEGSKKSVLRAIPK